MCSHRFACLFFLSIFLFPAQLFAQAKQKLTPNESSLVTQESAPDHPLHDYVACTFHPADRGNLHSLFGKSGSTAIAAARVGIEMSDLSPQKAAIAQQQVDILSRTPGVTLSNIGALISQKLQSSSAEQTDTQKKLTPDEIAKAAKNTEDTANYAQTIHAPNDIGCSESVLTYAEAKDIFGQRVADTYIAVQVTLRNLNPDSEFLLHDIQVAVRTDLYFATRDRRLARGVAEIGQMVNPRNETFRYLDGAASALGIAAVPIGGIAFSDAAHGFSSFVPVLKGVFPDYSVAQLGRLDDLGFSSGSLTYVIPKSGAHSMVAFIPEKIYRTALLTASKDQSENSSSKEVYKKFKNYTTSDLKDFQNNLEILIAGAHIKEVSTTNPTASSFGCDDPKTDSDTSITCHLAGKDLDQAKAVKLVFKSDSTEGSATSDSFAPDKTDLTKATVTFTKASFDSLKKGQSYSVVLVTKDDADVLTTVTFTPKQPSSVIAADASSLTCDDIPKGTGTDATISCQLAGKNTQLVKQLKLIPTGGGMPSTASIKFEPDGTDHSKATVTFRASDFAGLKEGSKYSINLVTQDNVEVKTTATFSPKATATQPDTSKISCNAPKGAGNAATVSCSLAGNNLQLVAEVSLVGASGNASDSVESSKFIANPKDSTKATAIFVASDFAHLKTGKPYKVRLKAKDGTEIETSAVFTPKPPVPNATSLSCNVPMGTNANSMLDCELQGGNLQLVKGVKLTSTLGSTTTSIDSTKFVSNPKDSAKATVNFAKPDFENLKIGQSYKIFLITKSGADVKTEASYSPK
jgi:hypothetical protein